MKQLYAPNGKGVIGTDDRIEATALVNGWSEEGEPVYAGQSDVSWDSQKTQTDDDHGCGECRLSGC